MKSSPVPNVAATNEASRRSQPATANVNAIVSFAKFFVAAGSHFGSVHLFVGSSIFFF